MTTNIFATQDWVETQIPDVGLELVETIIISNDPFIEFTSLDDGYTHKFILEDVVVVTDATILQIQFSRDGGSSYVTSANYEYVSQAHNANGDIQVDVGTTDTEIHINSTSSNMGLGNASGEGFFGIVICPKPSDTTVYKRVYFEAAYLGVTGSTTHLNGSGGLLDAASAYDALKFYMSSGNLSTGKIKHYRYS